VPENYCIQKNSVGTLLDDKSYTVPPHRHTLCLYGSANVDVLLALDKDPLKRHQLNTRHPLFCWQPFYVDLKHLKIQHRNRLLVIKLYYMYLMFLKWIVMQRYTEIPYTRYLADGSVYSMPISRLWYLFCTNSFLKSTFIFHSLHLRNSFLE
jgi:hypothetical protein